MSLQSAVDYILYGKESIALSYQDGATQQFVILNGVDMWLSENHSIETKTTKYPIESGYSITDNAYIKPRELKLVGYVSNVRYITPAIPFVFGNIGLNNKWNGNEFDSNLNPKSGNQKISNAWQNLKRIQTNFSLVKAVTNIEVYGAKSGDDLIITELDTTLNSETGTSMQFNMTLRQIKIVSSQETSISPNKVAGINNPARNSTSNVDGGNIPPLKISKNKAKEINDSLLDRGWAGIGNWVKSKG